MNLIIQSLLLAIVALLGIPIGEIITKNTKEEIRAGRKWIRAVAIISIAVFAASIFLINDPVIRPWTATVAGFLFLVAYTSLRKA